MPTNSGPTKEILYNILRREVHNMIQGVPMIGMFEGVISNYLITAIEPYINAFTGENQKIDIDQLAAYTKYEVDSKIAKFKETYKAEVDDRG